MKSRKRALEKAGAEHDDGSDEDEVPTEDENYGDDAEADDDEARDEDHDECRIISGPPPLMPPSSARGRLRVARPVYDV